MDKELLSFKIGLSGTYWDKKPQYSIFINDQKMASGIADNQVSYVEFDIEVDQGEVKLQIKLQNKSDEDTVESEDKTTILKDMLLNIHNIEIDQIDIDSLKWTKSDFVADDPQRPTLKNCINLGWNGTYTFYFSSPFYMWLLENM